MGSLVSFLFKITILNTKKKSTEGQRAKGKGQRVKGLECRGLKSPGRRTHNPKPDTIAAVARVVAVAGSGTAIPRLIEPRTAT